MEAQITTSERQGVAISMKHQKNVELVRLSSHDVMEVTHYHGRGSRTVVAIPGLGASALLFDSLVECLPADLSLMILHHRGIGSSSNLREDETLHTLTDELVQFLELRSFELCQKFDLLGISYGGFLAQLMMLKSPALFSSIALFCTSSGGAQFTPLLNISDEALAAQEAMPLEQRACVSALYTTSKKTQESPSLFSKITQQRMESATPLETTLWQNNEAKKFLSAPLALELIKAPTLVMSGDEDRVVPVKNSEVLARKIPQAKVVIVKDTDHLFFMEKPVEVMKQYRDFLFQKMES